MPVRGEERGDGKGVSSVVEEDGGGGLLFGWSQLGRRVISWETVYLCQRVVDGWSETGGELGAQHGKEELCWGWQGGGEGGGEESH